GSEPRHGPSIAGSKSRAFVAGRPSGLMVAGSKSLRAMSCVRPSVLFPRLIRDDRQLDRRREGLDLADLRAREGVHDGDDEGVGLDLRAFLGALAAVDLDHGLAAALAV